MNIYRIFFLLTILCTGSLSSMLAQEITKSALIEKIDGREYYIHIVEQGQTLYSLSKVYDVPVDELIFENPDAKESLAIGQELKIPVISREKTITDDLREGDFRFIFHIVKKGQTLYAISRIYDVSIDDLKLANPEWEKGLKPGQYLRIPMKEPDEAQAVIGKEPVHIQEEQVEEKYMEHTVKQKETLYGIARDYRISIDSLKAFNPGLTQNIYPGEVIRIPLRVNPDDFITHTVREKTKLKKVASKYTVSLEAMKDANPGIRNRVYPGERLLIPVGPASELPPGDTHVVVKPPDDLPPRIEKTDSVRCFERKHRGNDEYRIALMIPLYTEEVGEIDLSHESGALDPKKFKSFNFIQFYEGFLMALQEMEQKGLRVKLYVYDVDEKVSKTIQVLQDPALTEMDLIIGPFFSRNFKLVSNFAEMFDINIVNPLTRRAEVLVHDNVYKVKPDRKAQIEMLTDFVRDYHPTSNIILVRANKFQYEDETSAIREKLDSMLPYGVKIANTDIYDLITEYSDADTNLAWGTLIEQLMIENRLITTTQIENSLDDSTFFSNGIAELIYSMDSINGIMRYASVVRNNLVIVITNNEIFAPEILTRLNDLKDTFDISVVGMPEWELLDNLETDYLLDLDVHFFTDSYLDMRDPDVEAFIMEFRNRYKTHPDRYAFEGYDLANFFLGALLRFGTDCDECLPYYRAEELKGPIRFVPASPAGYENVLWNFCRYRNYRIEKIELR